MKKLLFILSIAVFCGSCQGEFENIKYTITNDSSKSVTFTFNDIKKTLPKDTSVIYSISSEQGRFAPQEIIFEGHKKSVILEEPLNNGTAGIFYTFIDNTPFKLEVENTLQIPITVKADDFIAADADTSSGVYNNETLTLKVKENSKEKALIYTSTPKFSVEDERTETTETRFIPYPYPFPITADWELKDDNKINLTIK